ncbi:MAG: superoxide dismutase [Proteobacteria bacterium]|nr:superoxide dismutase [Pseudomonadota bacterium]
MAFTLPNLPFSLSALEPHISERTMSFHYGKHHQAYVTNLNNLIINTPFASLSLEEVIFNSYDKPDKINIFNNAAQVWNHTFFWYGMKPQGRLTENIKSLLEQHFGSLETFKEQFKQAAVTQFGSGWAWLVVKDNKLSILKTSNADLPMVHGYKALLTCDVWEHAYYLDFQNRRPDYVEIFLNHLVNWEFVEQNLHN